MDKRLKLFLIVLAGIILLALGAWIFLSPYLAERRAAQPPALPGEVHPVGPTQPSTSGVVPKPVGTIAPTSPATTTAPTSPSKTLAVQNRSRTVVERIGSGVSSDAFLGYRDVEEYFTANGVAALRAERAALMQQHPAGGPTYAISTKAASSQIAGAYGDATLVATVEAIQRIDAQGQPTVTVAKRITMTFAKQSDGSYLIDSLKWEDVAL